MYAVIATGGKQYKVAVGDTIFVERLSGAEGETVTFDQVLAVFGDDNKIGKAAAGVKVTGEIERHGRGKKIKIFKYKPKKGYRRRQGHRQPYTKVTIKSIA